MGGARTLARDLLADETVGRVVGTSALAAACAFFGVGAVEGGALPEYIGPYLLAAQSAFLIPLAAYLWRRLESSNRALATVSAVAGICSLFLWGTAPLTGAWNVEPVWIALSAVWWVGTGTLLRAFRRRWGTFTVILGIAAALDAVVTALEDAVPFTVFAVLGGPKLPLSLGWMVWSGVTLLREPKVATIRPTGMTSERRHRPSSSA